MHPTEGSGGPVTPAGGSVVRDLVTSDAAAFAPRRLGGRGYQFVALAGAVFLGIAAVKPWSPWLPDPVADTRTPAVTATPIAAGPARTPPQFAPNDVDLLGYRTYCPSPGWVVVVDDVTVTTPTRTWMVAESVPAVTGPDDTAIPFVRIASREIRTLGFCAPASTGTAGGSGAQALSPAATGNWTGTLWQIVPLRDDRSTWREAGRYTMSAGRMSDLLTAPRDTAASPSLTTTWPGGRYVLEAWLPGRQEPVFVGIELVVGGTPAPGATVPGTTAPTATSPVAALPPRTPGDRGAIARQRT